MTVLSSNYSIHDFSQLPHSNLNHYYTFGDIPNMVDNQSTLLREGDRLSLTNKLEIQKIRTFKDLDENWDSYEAQRICQQVIDRSIEIIIKIDLFNENIYFTSPGPNGEIMIQLKTGSKEVEIIVYPGKIKLVTFENNEFSKQSDFSADNLLGVIEWLNL